MEGISVSRLKNGMRVLTLSKSGRESVSVGLWYRVGGRYETESISGISHFIEHMLFKGTEKRSAKKIKEELEGRGAVLNGFTSEDTTCYLVKIIKRHLELAVDVISDMALNSLFDSFEMEKERNVILEEIKMYMDMPTHYAHDLINTLIWQGHPLGMFVAGTPETVSNITRSDILRFYSKFYVPNNSVLAVCGDVGHEEVVSIVEKYFSKRPGGSRNLTFKKYDAVQKKARYMFVNKDTEQAHIVLAFPSLPRGDGRKYILALLHIILGANMSSRLYEEVREKRGLAYEIRSGINYYDDVGSFTVSAGVENSKLEKALEVISRELSKIKHKNISKGELKRAKEYMINQLFFAIDDTMDYMLWAGEKYLHTGHIPKKEEILDAIGKVTVSDIRKMANFILKHSKVNMVAIGKFDSKDKEKMCKKAFLLL